MRCHLMYSYTCNSLHWETLNDKLFNIFFLGKYANFPSGRKRTFSCLVSSAKINKTVELGKNKRPEFHISMCKPLSLFIHKGLVALCNIYFFFIYIRPHLIWATLHPMNCIAPCGLRFTLSMGTLHFTYISYVATYQRTQPFHYILFNSQETFEPKDI
jgi:hypothetical protein